MSDPYTRWKATAVRRPEDVPAIAPLAWQIEKHTKHNDRLMNRALPADFPHPVERGDAGDALAVLALREAMRRDIETGRGTRVHEALTLGATWTEVAAALGTTPADARALLRDWVEKQHRLHQRDTQQRAAHPFGMDAEEHAAVLALLELGDDEPAPAPVEGAAR